VSQLIDALERHGIGSRVIWEPAERSAVLRAPELTDSCVCVVASGGDGTVADVINEQPNIPLAVLPVGNENVFAREFGFTKDAAALAKAIAAGRGRAIDLGCANRRRFSLMLGAGFDAEVVHRLARWRARVGSLRRATRLSYVRHILAALTSYRHQRVTLEADDVRITGTHAFVFNVPQYACRLRFAPDARPDDGLLDWVVFERPGAHRVLGYLLDVSRSRHLQRPDVHHGQARRLRITASNPAPVQLDGDPAGHTPTEIEVMPKTLRLLLP